MHYWCEPLSTTVEFPFTFEGGRVLFWSSPLQDSMTSLNVTLDAADDEPLAFTAFEVQCFVYPTTSSPYSKPKTE